MSTIVQWVGFFALESPPHSLLTLISNIEIFQEVQDPIWQNKLRFKAVNCFKSELVLPNWILYLLEYFNI